MNHTLAASAYEGNTNPAVRWMALFLGVAGLGLVFRNLRNARSWLLLVMGTKCTAVVDAIEMQIGSDDRTYKRPSVSFTDSHRTQLTASPVMFRKRYNRTPGSTVRVSRSRRNPERIAVHGFDFRASEVVSLVIGVLFVVVSIHFCAQ